jgi:hypothetical protein
VKLAERLTLCIHFRILTVLSGLSGRKERRQVKILFKDTESKIGNFTLFKDIFDENFDAN